MIAIHVFFSILSQITPEPKFSEQVLDDHISIGYGLAIGDVDGDRKPDILLADKKQFVWYRNGDWKRFVMVENLTEFDNVCIAARDIDGDGKVEVAVGAQWNPGETSDTLKSGSVHYLVRPSDPTQLWRPIELSHEPTIHRMKWVQIGQNQYRLVVVPLHGRGNKNGEGKGVRIYAYEKPEVMDQPWKRLLIDSSMHLTHNFDVAGSLNGTEDIYVAGKEGSIAFRFSGRKWEMLGWTSIREQGFGELRVFETGGLPRHAFITPMHGNQLGLVGMDAATYKHLNSDSGKWKVVSNTETNNIEHTLTSDLNQGHALAAGDILGSGGAQVVVGWREPNKENKVGIKMFVNQDRLGKIWKDYWIDNNGMACEDLQVADLDGDGRKDIIASGRASHNLKIYWNKSGAGN